MGTDDAEFLGEFCAGVQLYQTILKGQKQSALQTALDELRAAKQPASAVVAAFWDATRVPRGSLRTVDVEAPPTAPPQGSYACPAQACDRRADRDPGGPQPFCEVYRRSMIYQP